MCTCPIRADHRPAFLTSLLLCALAAATTPARAQSAANLLLIVNETSTVSGRIADHYARVRGVPQDNVLRLKVPETDEVSFADFARLIATPIATWLTTHAAHDRILYLVLTKGMPLRIAGTSGREGTVASVDSELTVLYRRLTGVAAPVTGRVPNPYFLGEAPLAKARPFSHETQDIFLVTRLDGFTEADVVALIDRSVAPSREGRIVLDGKAAIDDQGNKWLQAASDWLAANGFKDRVIFDATSRVIRDERDILGYYSWGSNDPAIKVRRFGFGFVPGALAATYVSSDGRTFTEPPADWQIGTWTDRKTFFAGSPQSLAGDLVREGVTGVAGHVAEPYLDATIRPQILFPAYLSGFTLAEAFYLAMPYLSWQTVIVGDPLCAPFPRQWLSPSDIDKSVDAATELPTLFAARRLAALAAATPGAKPEALKAVLRGEVRMAREDRAGARAAFEEATARDPSLTATHLALASLYEQAEQYDLAIERYRKVLAASPNHVIALNNLAYALAVRKNQPQEALGLAERAWLLSRGSANVADTLGWIQHLLGNDAEAARLVGAAAKALPDNAEIRFHLAAVHAAAGALEAAERELAKAIELDPELEKRDEVKALRAKIKR